jgi:hypothetical protein
MIVTTYDSIVNIDNTSIAKRYFYYYVTVVPSQWRADVKSMMIEINLIDAIVVHPF